MKKKSNIVIAIWSLLALLLIAIVLLIALLKPTQSQLYKIIRIVLALTGIIIGILIGVFFIKDKNWIHYSWIHGFGDYSWPNKRIQVRQEEGQRENEEH